MQIWSFVIKLQMIFIYIKKKGKTTVLKHAKSIYIDMIHHKKNRKTLIHSEILK